MSKARWILTAVTALAIGGMVRSFGQDAKQAAPKFEIRKATYEAVDGSKGADVTEKVRALVVDGKLSMNATNQVLGGDPVPGRVKQLRVEYAVDGKPEVVIVRESGALDIPPISKEEQIAKLIPTLKSADASLYDKSDACRQLAIVGGKDAIPVLAGLLTDEKLSHMARYALEPNPDPSVDEVFRQALGQVKGKLLVGVITSIGVRRDAKAVEPLTQLLKDSDSDVASAAATTLGRIGNPPAAQALEQALNNAPDAIRPAVCDALMRCADAFAAEGKTNEAVAIYDRLRSLPAPRPIDMAALRGAILARGNGGATLLVEQVRSSDPRCFAVALRVAIELPGEETTKALAAELAKLAVDRQPLLILALSKRGDAPALAALLTAAKSGETDVRVAAIQALPEIGDPSSVPLLVTALSDPDAKIAKAALDSLGGMPGKAADDAVVALLSNPEPARRLNGIELVDRRRMLTAISTLLKMTDDADQSVRLAAFKTLGQLGGAAETPALLDRLINAKESKEMDAAEKALRSIFAKMDNADPCAEKAIERLAQVQPAQKIALLRVLSAGGGAKALQAVRAAVNDPNAEVHSSAIRTLGKWRTSDAAPVLLELANTSPDETDKLLCLRSTIGLAANPELPDDQRLAICKQAASLIRRDDETKLLLGTLGNIPTHEAMAVVMTYLDNPTTKEEACAAALSIAARLMQGRGAAKHGARLVEPLQKVAKTTTNPGQAKRANDLLSQAQGKGKRK